MDPVLFSSASSEYGTPAEIFDPVADALGLNFDAAASHENHKLPHYATMAGTFTQHFSTPSQRTMTDGLEAPWSPLRVWCNPPYGRDVVHWVQKAALEHRKGCPVVAMLLPARTDTDWFHRWVAPYAEVHFLMGRIKFIGTASSAPFPSIIAVYAPEIHIAPGDIMARRWDPRSGPFESAVSTIKTFDNGRSVRQRSPSL
jgi:site-specific DNA-methyltransferase (adenine-specific)